MKSYVEVILSKFIYYNPWTIIYKCAYWRGYIWRIVRVQFWKQALNWLVVNEFEELPSHLNESKVKDVIEVYPENYGLSKEYISVIYDITNYYFSSLTHVACLFLPKNIFNPPKKLQIEEWNWKYIVNQGNFKLLSGEQESAYKTLSRSTNSLLYWVTWSWKTEVYKALIRDVLIKWGQVLFMVPEIMLTPQMRVEFEEVFDKEQIAVVSSHLTPAGKAKVWHKVKSWKIWLVIWSRSSIFLPFKDLRLIIVDEEHEWTYKNENWVRYRVNKVAEILAKYAKINLIFGSATPDFNDYYNSKHIVTINNRYGNSKMPDIELVDLKNLNTRKSFISPRLLELVKQVLESNKQVILFINQRGYNSSMVCRACWKCIMCNECDVSMTYHKPLRWDAKLICHYCGKIEKVPIKCWYCSSGDLLKVWIGTQLVEKEIGEYFRWARVFRADSDTIKTIKDREALYWMLSTWKIDILVGTQMIAKWLDISWVSLVWIIFADSGMQIPDYKASEKIFGLLCQVSGRSWRRWGDSKVLIQAFNNEHYAIKHAVNNDFKSIYSYEIEKRRNLKYPPFVEVIKLILKDKDIWILQSRARNLYEQLKDVNIHYFGSRFVINTSPALIPKLLWEYIWNIVIRWIWIEDIMNKLDKMEFYKWTIDRDPNNLI